MRRLIIWKNSTPSKSLQTKSIFTDLFMNLKLWFCLQNLTTLNQFPAFKTLYTWSLFYSCTVHIYMSRCWVYICWHFQIKRHIKLLYIYIYVRERERRREGERERVEEREYVHIYIYWQKISRERDAKWLTPEIIFGNMNINLISSKFDHLRLKWLFL